MVKEDSMKAETSMFESSEMLATFLASTPLIEEAWKLCSHANSAAPQSFVVNQIEDVTYFAFSGVQACNLMNPPASSNTNTLVPLESAAANGIFSALRRDVEAGKDDDDLVMVHSGFLNHFLSFFNNPSFQNQMVGIMNNSKSIIFTGHSVGGTIASLSALWLLSRLQTISSPLAVLCITFGSPMLGNESFSRAILEERWGGNFCHVVAQDDIVPTLLFAPLAPLTQQLHYLFHFWHSSMMSPYSSQLATQISDEKITEVFYTVLASLEALSGGKDPEGSRFWPFGSYIFCTSKGAICLDHAMSILKLLYVMLAKGSPRSSVEDHLKYEEYVGVVHWQFLKRRSFTGSNLAESNYDAGVALALQSSGINSLESISGQVKDSLEIAKQGRRRNLNSAKLTVELYNTKTLRVQIEWYKAFCDESDDQMGYYDSMRARGASKRETKVNLNRLKLASFWNNVIKMLETNQLPYDFHKQSRWVNGSQFYKLLVEPLEIAEYYRNEMHWKKGHYLENGREKRYKIFDKWWSERDVDNEKSIIRNEFASLTQDSCFWARVEEARDWLNLVRTENDKRKQYVLLDKINKFEQYAEKLIEKKEVSKDVLKKNSSYTLFVKDWRELKSQLLLFQPQFPGFLDGEQISPAVGSLFY